MAKRVQQFATANKADADFDFFTETYGAHRVANVIEEAEFTDRITQIKHATRGFDWPKDVREI